MPARRHVPASGKHSAAAQCPPPHGLPPVELERACVESVEGVVEAAAVACPPPGGGPDQLHLFLVLRPGVAAAPADLQQRCQAAIGSRLNPLFKVSGSRSVLAGSTGTPPHTASPALGHTLPRRHASAARRPPVSAHQSPEPCCGRCRCRPPAGPARAAAPLAASHRQQQGHAPGAARRAAARAEQAVGQLCGRQPAAGGPRPQAPHVPATLPTLPVP